MRDAGTRNLPWRIAPDSSVSHEGQVAIRQVTDAWGTFSALSLHKLTIVPRQHEHRTGCLKPHRRHAHSQPCTACNLLGAARLASEVKLQSKKLSGMAGHAGELISLAVLRHWHARNADDTYGGKLLKGQLLQRGRIRCRTGGLEPKS